MTKQEANKRIKELLDAIDGRIEMQRFNPEFTAVYQSDINALRREIHETMRKAKINGHI